MKNTVRLWTFGLCVALASGCGGAGTQLPIGGGATTAPTPTPTPVPTPTPTPVPTATPTPLASLVPVGTIAFGNGADGTIGASPWSCTVTIYQAVGGVATGQGTCGTGTQPAEAAACTFTVTAQNGAVNVTKNGWCLLNALTGAGASPAPASS